MRVIGLNSLAVTVEGGAIQCLQYLPSVAWAALLAQAKLQSLTLSLQQKLIGRVMFNPLEAVQTEGLDKV